MTRQKLRKAAICQAAKRRPKIEISALQQPPLPHCLDLLTNASKGCFLRAFAVASTCIIKSSVLDEVFKLDVRNVVILVT